jgi:hypothetical protein
MCVRVLVPIEAAHAGLEGKGLLLLLRMMDNKVKASALQLTRTEWK